jgi:hypothetical protein
VKHAHKTPFSQQQHSIPNSIPKATINSYLCMLLRRIQDALITIPLIGNIQKIMLDSLELEENNSSSHEGLLPEWRCVFNQNSVFT